MALGEKYDQFQFEEECSIRHLSSASLLIILLLKLSVGLTDEEESILRATLLPDIQLNTEQVYILLYSYHIPNHTYTLLNRVGKRLLILQLFNCYEQV